MKTIYLNLKRIGLIQKLVVLTIFSFFYVSQYAHSIVCSDTLNSSQNSGSNVEIKSVGRPEVFPLTRFDAQRRVIEETNPQFNVIRDIIKKSIENAMAIDGKNSLDSSDYGVGLIGDMNVRERLRELKALVEGLNDSTGGVLDGIGRYDKKSPQFDKDNFDNIVQILKIVTHVNYRKNLLTEIFLHPRESLENILVSEIKKLRHNFSNLEAVILIQKYLDNYNQNYNDEGMPKLLKKYDGLPEDTLIISHPFVYPDNPFVVKPKLSYFGSNAFLRVKVNFLQKNGESVEVWTNVTINGEVLLHNVKTGESKLARSTAKAVYLALPGGGTITDNLASEVVSHLAKYGIDAISIALPLHGGGPCLNPSCMNLEDLISFIVAFLKKYLPDVPIIIGGHSLGGKIVEAIRRESFKKDSFFNPELGRVLGLFAKSSLFFPHIKPLELKYKALAKTFKHIRTELKDQFTPAEQTFLKRLLLEDKVGPLSGFYSIGIILKQNQTELRDEEKSTNGLPTFFMTADRDALVHLGFNDKEVLQRILKIVTGEDHSVLSYNEYYESLPNSTYIPLHNLPFRNKTFVNKDGKEFSYTPVGHLLGNYFITENALEKLKEESPAVRGFLNNPYSSPMGKDATYRNLHSEPVHYYFLRQFISQLLKQNLEVERNTRGNGKEEEALLEILQLFFMDFSFRRWVLSRKMNTLERTSDYKTDKRELELSFSKQIKRSKENSEDKKQGSEKPDFTSNVVDNEQELELNVSRQNKGGKKNSKNKKQEPKSPDSTPTMGDNLISNLQSFSFREKFQKLLEVMGGNFESLESIKNLQGQVDNMLEFLSKNEEHVLVELLKLYSEIVKTQESVVEFKQDELKKLEESSWHSEKELHIRSRRLSLNGQRVKNLLRAKVLHARTDVLLAKNRHKENIAENIFIQKKIKYLEDLKSEHLKDTISHVQLEIKTFELFPIKEGDIDARSANEKRILGRNQEKARLESFESRREYPEDLFVVTLNDGAGILSISHYFDVLNLLKELQKSLRRLSRIDPMRNDERGTVGTDVELDHIKDIIEKMREAFGKVKLYSTPPSERGSERLKFTNFLERGYIVGDVNEFIRWVNAKVIEYYKNYDRDGYKVGLDVVGSSTSLQQHLKSRLPSFFQSNSFSFLRDNDLQRVVDLIMEYLANFNRLEETHIPTIKELFKKLKSYESRGNDTGHILYAVGETVADTKKNKKDFILERHRQIVQNVISRFDLSEELKDLKSKLEEALVIIELDNKGESILTPYEEWEKRINNYIFRLKEAIEEVYEDENFGKYSDELRPLIESHFQATDTFYETAITMREGIEVESSREDLSMEIINAEVQPKLDAYEKSYRENIIEPRVIFIREFIRAIRNGTVINSSERYAEDQKRYTEYREAAIALYGENSQYERFIKRSQEINEIERRIGEIKEEEFLLLQEYQKLVYDDFDEKSPYIKLSQKSFLELIEDVLNRMSPKTVQDGTDETSNQKALENIIRDWKGSHGVVPFLPVLLPDDLSIINYPTEKEIQLMNQWISE